MADTNLLLNKLNHEVRTPLNSIIGFSSLLLQRNYDYNKVKELSQHINNSGVRLMLWLDKINFLLSLKNNLIEPQNAKINVKVFLENTIKTINEFLQHQNAYAIHIKYNSDFLKSEFEGDNTLLIQILSNIIIEYILHGTLIKLNIWLDSSKLGSIEIVKINDCTLNLCDGSHATHHTDISDIEIYSQIINSCFKLTSSYTNIASDHKLRETNFRIRPKSSC